MFYDIVENKILELVNQCLRTGNYTSKLKISKVIPILRKKS